MKYVFVCENPDCPDYGVQHDSGKCVLVWSSKLKRLVPENAVEKTCQTCGRNLVFEQVESVIPKFGVNGFKSLPDDKKKEILRKRFDGEMKRGANDEREMRKREGLSKFLGHDK